MFGTNLFYFGNVALWLADEVDSIFSAAFGFEQCFVGLLEKLLYSLAVAGETGQAAADCQDAYALGKVLKEQV